MGKRTENKQKLFAALPALAILCAFSSCAGSKPNGPAADTPPTESQLLEDSSKVSATDVADAGVFADLDAAKKNEDMSAAQPADGDTYYSSIGGESLRRVAFTLYSNKAFAKKLLAKNPELKGVAKLSAEQKVYFDMGSARPEPRFLTKDLMARYTEPLAERLNSAASAKGLVKTSVTINKGETLQELSKRLYGTHRYWTEIYLVNHEKIKNYDRVPAGLSLLVVDRPNAGIAKAEAPVVLAHTEAPAPPPAPKKEVKPLPVVAPSAAVLPPPPIQETTHEVVTPPQLLDPMPETTPAPAAVPPPVSEAKVAAPKAVPVVAAHIEAPEHSANSNLRRILYFVLVLTIGGAAFYFTRTPKRPSVDMLDAATDVGRPKLSPKDTQKSQIG